ncbi:MAG TPA: PLP-dependent aminotransferase family protein, partial [Thermoanaerobacterales bacterium]|nr:PLP-dependent aminotransferase family protein [Thermoanaerobacterales bacterium]
AIDAFKSRGAKIVEIPMEEDGINLDIFLTKLKNKPPKLFYTMPNFQNPTGYSYSREKKKELLDLSLKYNFLIIEDDHMNDLYYEEKPVPLKTLDNAGRVLYIKSFSKLFMPGLRLAFILSPREYAKKIADVKYFTDISSSGLTQRAMDLFLRKTLWPKHVKNIRSIFLKKRNAIKESFKIMPSEVNYTIPNGGLFFWVSLPEGFYSMNLYNEALKHDILIMPGDIFFPEKRPSTGFRMSFAEIAPDDINDGVELLSKIIDEFLDKYRISPIRGTGYRPLI